MSTYIRKSNGSGQLNGSLGRGSTAPSSSPIESPTPLADSAPVSSRPDFSKAERLMDVLAGQVSALLGQSRSRALPTSLLVDSSSRLDRWAIEDANEWSLLVQKNRDRLVPWFPPMADASPRAFVEWVTSPRESPEAGVFHYAIRQEGLIVGSLSAWKNSTGAAELGFWMGSGSSGRGILDRSIRRLIPELKGAGFSRLEIHARAENAGSARVAFRNGFKLDGRYSGRPGHGDLVFDRHVRNI